MPDGVNSVPKKPKQPKLDLKEFSAELMRLQPDFKMSSRGWCYYLEGMGIITKGQFGYMQDVINRCRKLGLIPIDFVASDLPRSFNFTHNDNEDPKDYFYQEAYEFMNISKRYHPDPWMDEEYYIQILVEKIDLVTLFEPICKIYRIPVATAKGWSDIYQRGEIADRFSRMECWNKKPILLYMGDHDPAGLFISDTLKKNFFDISQGYMEGSQPWDPTELIIDRFGLNYDFIVEHDLTWIDNLETGSGNDLMSEDHRDHYKPYVRDYIAKYGARKVEANALVKDPDGARQLLIRTIDKYLGKNSWQRFRDRIDMKRGSVQEIISSDDEIDFAIKVIREIEKKKDGGEADESDPDEN